MTNRFEKSAKHFQNAKAAMNRILDGSVNLPPAMAWAVVIRECSLAQSAIRNGAGDYLTRFELTRLDLIDSVKWVAKANLQTIVAGLPE